MGAAVNLNAKPRLVAIEIEYIGTRRMLPPKV
jgi:hypothetical protein